MTSASLEPAQLRDFRSEFQASPELCERALGVLGEPAPEPKRGSIRCSRENVDRAICRALAHAAVHRGIYTVEIEGKDAETKI